MVSHRVGPRRTGLQRLRGDASGAVSHEPPFPEEHPRGVRVPPAPSTGANVPRAPLPGAYRVGCVCHRPRLAGPMCHEPRCRAVSGGVRVALTPVYGAKVRRPRECSAPDGGWVVLPNGVVAAIMSLGARRCGNDVVGTRPVVSPSGLCNPANPSDHMFSAASIVNWRTGWVAQLPRPALSGPMCHEPHFLRYEPIPVRVADGDISNVRYA
jgi:hypothetical protein